MDFDEDKSKYMERLNVDRSKDRSKKGSVDEAVIPLLDKINRSEDYYTTSSCAGRIVLLAYPESRRKDEAEWLLASHEKVDFEDVSDALKDKAKNYTCRIYFRQESAILHVCCRSIASAQKLINHAKACGFKRSGIMATKRRVMIEIMGSEKLDAPVALDGKIIVDDPYLRILVMIANERFLYTRQRLLRFEESLIL